MFNNWIFLPPILLPMLGGLLLALCKPLSEPRTRKYFTLGTLVLSLLALIPALFAGDQTLTLFTISDNLPMTLASDQAGRFFALVMALVWVTAGIYSFEYMAHEKHQTRYYAFYLTTLGVLMALCFAGSIVTYYMCYELMTLLTVPLVMHTMHKDAVAAGVKYLIYSVIGASLVLLGVFVLAPYVTGFGFAAKGVLAAEKVQGHEGVVLFCAFLMLLGFSAKGGLFPLHGWLPTAHPAAPAPASAVLSGIITKAGVLGVVRVIYYYIGADFLQGTWVQTAMLVLTLFTVFLGSLLAWQEKVLKKRLAFSSVSQVSYVLFGLCTMHPLGVVGALLHVVAHALIKDSLFMSAGAIIHQTGKTRVEEMRGIGKQMPVVMVCYTLVSLGLIGIPPCLGFVSKWYLAQGGLSMTGVASALTFIGPAILLISALLTAGYLLPLTINGFLPGRDEAGKLLSYEKCEPSLWMLLPLGLLTALSVVLGMFPTQLISFLTNLTATIL